MTKQLFIAAMLAAASSTPALAESAHADYDQTAYAPVPPNVEGEPVAAAQGAYCYGGPHPVDTRVAAGQPWDEIQGNHTHFYPPFDLRLFSVKDGCYHFIGDPRDFGYRGPVNSYYGAHPIMEDHGGGWCFMIGGHGHWWRPWSPFFVTMGPWFYWHGPYDPFFHSYWPYYAVYYRSHYPRYYGGGRFHRARNGGWAVAPPVGRVAAPPARAMPAGGGGMMGAAPARASRFGDTSTSTAVAPVGSAWGGSQQMRPATGAQVPGPAPGSAWGGHMRTAPQMQAAPSPSWGRPAQQPAPTTAPAPSWGRPMQVAPSSSWGGNMRTAPAPSFRSAPSQQAAPRWAPSPSSGGMRTAPSSGSSGSFGGAVRSGGGSSSSGGGGGLRGGWRR